MPTPPPGRARAPKHGPQLSGMADVDVSALRDRFSRTRPGVPSWALAGGDGWTSGGVSDREVDQRPTHAGNVGLASKNEWDTAPAKTRNRSRSRFDSRRLQSNRVKKPAPSMSVSSALAETLSIQARQRGLSDPQAARAALSLRPETSGHMRNMSAPVRPPRTPEDSPPSRRQNSRGTNVFSEDDVKGDVTLQPGVWRRYLKSVPSSNRVRNSSLQMQRAKMNNFGGLSQYAQLQSFHFDDVTQPHFQSDGLVQRSPSVPKLQHEVTGPHDDSVPAVNEDFPGYHTTDSDAETSSSDGDLPNGVPIADAPPSREARAASELEKNEEKVLSDPVPTASPQPEQETLTHDAVMSAQGKTEISAKMSDHEMDKDESNEENDDDAAFVVDSEDALFAADESYEDEVKEARPVFKHRRSSAVENLPVHKLGKRLLLRSLQTEIFLETGADDARNVSPESKNLHETISFFNANEEPSIDKLRSRRAILDEMLASERTFVKYLRAVVEVYFEPLMEESRRDGFITEPEVDSIFGNVPGLLALNQTLLQKMEVLLSPESRTGTLTDQSMGVALIFIEHSALFRGYAFYASNHMHAFSTLLELRSKNKDFQNFYDSAKLDPQCASQNLESLLIMPAQRIPRYEIFLKRLLKHTSPQHHDFEPLKKAVTLITDVNDDVESTMKIAESRNEVSSIEASFGHTVQLSSPSRRFILNSEISFDDGRREYKCRLFLFNNMLLIGKPKGHHKYAPVAEHKFTPHTRADIVRKQSIALKDKDKDGPQQPSNSEQQHTTSSAINMGNGAGVAVPTGSALVMPPPAKKQPVHHQVADRQELVEIRSRREAPQGNSHHIFTGNVGDESAHPPKKRRELVEIRPRREAPKGNSHHIFTGNVGDESGAQHRKPNPQSNSASAKSTKNGSALLQINNNAQKSLNSAVVSEGGKMPALSDGRNVVHNLPISNIQGIGEVSIIRSNRPSVSNSSTPSDTLAPAAKVPILPAPTSMRLAVACEMHGKFATPRQIPINYAQTRIPFGNVRHEVLQETGEHVLYINISPPGGVKYWMQISGFAPNRTTAVPPNASQVIPEPVIVSSRNEADLNQVATQTRWQRHGKTVTDIVAAVVAQATAAGIRVNPNPLCVQAQGMAELPQGQLTPPTNVCDACAVSLSACSDSVSTCAICCRSVHHACYGIPFGVTTNSSWQCDSCAENQTVLGGTAIPCVFCGKTGGMMKKTSDGKHWAHMLCAVYLSKAAFLMPYAAENIGAIDENGKRSGFETVLSFHACKNGQKCNVCNKDTGAVITCGAHGCNTVYHPRCAFDNGQLMFCKGEAQGTMRAEFISFCKHHSDLAARKSAEARTFENRPSSDEVRRNPGSLPYQGAYGQTLRVAAECARLNGMLSPFSIPSTRGNRAFASSSDRALANFGVEKFNQLYPKRKRHISEEHVSTSPSHGTSSYSRSKIVNGGTSCKESIESASVPMQLFLTKRATGIDSTTDFKDKTLQTSLSEQNWHGKYVAGVILVSGGGIVGKVNAGDGTLAKVNGTVVQSKRKSLEMIHHKLVPSFEESENVTNGEREQFMRDLRMFHDIVGTTTRRYGKDIALMKKLPRLSNKDIDLFLLMKYAVSYGGYRHLCTVDRCWSKLLRNLPKHSLSNASASDQLRSIYERYLRFFEAHFYPHLAMGHAPNRCFMKVPYFQGTKSERTTNRGMKSKAEALEESFPPKRLNKARRVDGHALFSGFVKGDQGLNKSEENAFEGSDGLFKVRDKRASSFSSSTKSNAKAKGAKKSTEKQPGLEKETFGGFVFSSSTSAL
eukprot:g5206.t1